jgi:hypothetical protein
MNHNNLPIRKILFILVLGLALTLGFSDQVLAQEQQGLVAIPPREGAQGNLRIKPGEKKQVNIRLRNISDKSLKVKSFTQDFVVKKDGQTPSPVKETVSNRWSLSSWMVVTPNFHQLAPKETVEMSVLIEAPEDAMPGGHYAMVIHEPTNETAESLQQGLEVNEAASAIGQRIGTLFYVTVEGPINEEAYIRDFNFKKFQEFGPVPFSYQVSNHSDIHIHPRMRIDIYNMLGQKAESLNIEPKNVFPLNSREFAGQWDKLWGFGLYKAKLNVSYGQAGKVAVATSNFWIVPVRIILAIILGILIITAIVVAIKRHMEHRYEQEKAKIKELQDKVKQYEQEKSSENKQE